MAKAIDSRASADVRGQLLLRLVPQLVHRLNNAFCVVEGMAELLARNESDPGRLGYMRVLADEAQKSAALLRGMALFAQPQEPSRGAIDLGVIAGQAVDLLKPLLFQQCELALERRGQLHGVRADPRALLQMAMLVLSDAAPDAVASGAPSRARVRCSAADASVHLTIAAARPGERAGPAGPSGAVLEAAGVLAAQASGRIRGRARPGRGWVVRASFPALAALLE